MFECCFGWGDRRGRVYQTALAVTELASLISDFRPMLLHSVAVSVCLKAFLAQSRNFVLQGKGICHEYCVYAGDIVSERFLILTLAGPQAARLVRPAALDCTLARTVCVGVHG